jgi:hypothetical protein
MNDAAYKPLLVRLLHKVADDDTATTAYIALQVENERKRVQLESFKAWARSVAYRTNGAASHVERVIHAEAVLRGGDPDE